MRRIDSDEVREFEVSGEKIEAVTMLPGYTHNIINLSDTEDLVTVMYCNETFNPQHPDTFGENV
jgi:UDP-2-acetamido-2,6-beta-L-arabino-hexul-4-ose reductase